MTKAQRFFTSIKDKRVGFIGTGVSHTQLIRVFLSKGIKVVILDKRTRTISPKTFTANFRQRALSFRSAIITSTKCSTAILFSVPLVCISITRCLPRRARRAW